MSCVRCPLVPPADLRTAAFPYEFNSSRLRSVDRASCSRGSGRARLGGKWRWGAKTSVLLYFDVSGLACARTSRGVGEPKADLLFRSVLGLATAVQGPPPPRVAHSTPLGLLYLGTHMFFRRAAGSVVAPGFVVSPRPSGAFPKGVCTRLGGFPAPRRKTDGRVPSPSGLKKSLAVATCDCQSSSCHSAEKRSASWPTSAKIRSAR